MKQFLQALWREDDGVLTTEWVLMASVLVIGIVIGVAAARDAVVDEIGDAAQAVVALDQSYVIPPPLIWSFTDVPNAVNEVPVATNIVGLDQVGHGTGSSFQDCAVAYGVDRGEYSPPGQEAEMDED